MEWQLKLLLFIFHEHFFISKTRVHDTRVTHRRHCMLILALWNPADNSYEEKICGIPFFYILNSEDKNSIGMAVEIATVYFSGAVFLYI